MRVPLDFTVRDPAGNVRKGVEIILYELGTEIEVPIYAAALGPELVAQPLITGPNGRIPGPPWVDLGIYDRFVPSDLLEPRVPWVAGVASDLLDLVGNALVYRGAIDASANPNYPAADAGHTYRISVAGRIGGAAGPKVEVGDMLICTADATPAGDHAAVGASWEIVQANIDGAVIGPAAAVDGHLAEFDTGSGKLLADSGVPSAEVIRRGTVDSVTAMGLVIPDGNSIDGYVVKAPDINWDQPGTGYGMGQAFMLLREDYAGAPGGGVDAEPDKNVLFRVDGRTGGVGFGGGIHIATGLRQHADFADTQAAWIQLYKDIAGLIIQGFTGQTADLLQVIEKDSGVLFKILASGLVQSLSRAIGDTSGFSIGRNNTVEGALGILATDSIPTIPGAAGDLFIHLNDVAKGIQLSVGATILLSISTLGLYPGVDVVMSTHKVTGMGDPVNNQDAATKAYVDGKAPFGVNPGSYFSPPYLGAVAGGVAGTNTLYWAQVFIPRRTTLTGIFVWNGGTVNGNLLVALYDSAGARQAVSASTAQAGANAAQKVPFTAPITIEPGIHYIAVMNSGATGTFLKASTMSPATSAAQGGFATPDPLPSLPSTLLATFAVMGTY